MHNEHFTHSFTHSLYYCSGSQLLVFWNVMRKFRLQTCNPHCTEVRTLCCNRSFTLPNLIPSTPLWTLLPLSALHFPYSHPLSFLLPQLLSLLFKLIFEFICAQIYIFLYFCDFSPQLYSKHMDTIAL